MAIFLGVDGGGTKTEFAVVDDGGVVLAEFLGPSSYYFDSDISLVDKVLSEGVRAVCDAANVRSQDILSAFFGIPGYGESSGDLAALNAIPARILGHERYRCDNDMVCSWAGSLGGNDGIGVIAGTGSMAYGQNEGRALRVGGWGELFGDEGSAYWLAIQGLNAFTRMSDGRLQPGPLYGIFSRSLNLGADEDVVHLVINEWGSARREIADLARSVSAAALHGDTHARSLLERAGEELAALAVTAASRLKFSAGQRVPVSYSGGVFSNETVLDAFRGALGGHSNRFDVRAPLLPPVFGAVILAARSSDSPLGVSALETLRSTIRG